MVAFGYGSEIDGDCIIIWDIHDIIEIELNATRIFQDSIMLHPQQLKITQINPSPPQLNFSKIFLLRSKNIREYYIWIYPT